MEIRSLSEFVSLGGTFEDFDCGNRDLNNYLKKHSMANDSLRIGKTYFLIDYSELIGFFTISMGFVVLNVEERAKLGNAIPRYPMPALVLGRFAIDVRFQGRGFGTYMLAKVLEKSLELSKDIGCFFVTVKPKSESRSFYKERGFVPLKDNAETMVISLSEYESVRDETINNLQIRNKNKKQ